MLSTVSRSGRLGNALLANSYSLKALVMPAAYATGASDKVIELTSDKGFTELLGKAADTGALTICDFTAKWCGPCRMIAPIYSQFSVKYPDVSFVKIDIDNSDLANTVNDHGITGVPTFVYYKGGRRVESFSGARPDLLEELIKKHTK